jgi:hypothetical protein
MRVLRVRARKDKRTGFPGRAEVADGPRFVERGVVIDDGAAEDL